MYWKVPLSSSVLFSRNPVLRAMVPLGRRMRLQHAFFEVCLGGQAPGGQDLRDRRAVGVGEVGRFLDAAFHCERRPFDRRDHQQLAVYSDSEVAFGREPRSRSDSEGRGPFGEFGRQDRLRFVREVFGHSYKE